MAALARKFLFLFSFLTCLFSNVIALDLVQVVILGRHNLRTPLASWLNDYTQKTWPPWNKSPGALTEKGVSLETYMGEYFKQWLDKHKLISGCPKNESVFVYANAKPRTIETAKVFTESAFKNCSVIVNYKKNVRTDPVFHPVVKNVTDAFKLIAIKEMQEKLNKIDIKHAYEILNNVLEINKSKVCTEKGICDLRKAKDEISLEVDREPDVRGPLFISNFAVDALLMYYYDGLPIKEIGWGKIVPENFKTLTEITKENQNVRFNNTILSLDIARPLLERLYQAFLKDSVKFSLFVGHDSNINSVLCCLKAKPFDLPEQYERSPIGGKIVFQKWHDKDLNRYFMKIEYVYQSTEQLRRGDKLSLENPPKSIEIELKNREKNENGFYAWEDFLHIFKELV